MILPKFPKGQKLHEIETKLNRRGHASGAPTLMFLAICGERKKSRIQVKGM